MQGARNKLMQMSRFCKRFRKRHQTTDTYPKKGCNSDLGRKKVTTKTRISQMKIAINGFCTSKEQIILADIVSESFI